MGGPFSFDVADIGDHTTGVTRKHQGKGRHVGTFEDLAQRLVARRHGHEGAGDLVGLPIGHDGDLGLLGVPGQEDLVGDVGGAEHEASHGLVTDGGRPLVVDELGVVDAFGLSRRRRARRRLVGLPGRSHPEVGDGHRPTRRRKAGRLDDDERPPRRPAA